MEENKTRLLELKQIFGKHQNLADLFRWITIGLVAYTFVHLLVFLASIRNIEQPALITNIIKLSYYEKVFTINCIDNLWNGIICTRNSISN